MNPGVGLLTNTTRSRGSVQRFETYDQSGFRGARPVVGIGTLGRRFLVACQQILDLFCVNIALPETRLTDRFRRIPVIDCRFTEDMQFIIAKFSVGDSDCWRHGRHSRPVGRQCGIRRPFAPAPVGSFPAGRPTMSVDLAATSGTGIRPEAYDRVHSAWREPESFVRSRMSHRGETQRRGSRPGSLLRSGDRRPRSPLSGGARPAPTSTQVLPRQG